MATVHPWGRELEDPPLTVTFRHSGWTRARGLIYDALIRTAQAAARLYEFRVCGSHAYILRSLTDPDRFRLAGSSCHDRFCLPCANERSHGIAMNVIDRIIGKEVRFLTLTVRSTDESLDQLLDKLYGSFQALRRRAFWKRRVTGGIAFLELTYSAGKERWHPHFHILIEGRFIPHQQIKALWYELTGDSHIVDIRLVRSTTEAARYVTKYASKPFNNTFVNRPNRLDEAIVTLKGRKLLTTFGDWRGVTLARPVTDDAWEHIGTLADFIAYAARGDTWARHVLSTLTDIDLQPIYARAPPQLPTLGSPPILEQLTFFGTWQHDGTWRNGFD